MPAGGALTIAEHGKRRSLARGEHARLAARVPWQAVADEDARVIVVLLRGSVADVAA